MDKDKLSREIINKLISSVEFNEINHLAESISILSECILDMVSYESIEVRYTDGFLEVIDFSDNKKYKLNKITKIFIDRFIDNANLSIDKNELEKDNFDLGVSRYNIEMAESNLENARKLIFLLKIMEREVILYNASVNKNESIDNTKSDKSNNITFVNISKESVKCIRNTREFKELYPNCSHVTID